MGSALLNPETADSTLAAIAGDSAAAGPNPAAFSGSAAALRLQAAERLAAHRSRRGNAQARPAPGPTRPATTRAARIAAVVAERYAHTQSYRAFLAAEAERAVQQARAAAEVATLNAQAVAAAQQSLLDTFDQAAFDQNAAEPDSVREDSPSAEPNAESHREPQVELRQGSQACNRQANQNQFTGNPHAEPPQPRPVELSLWPDLDPASTARSHHPTRPHRSTHEPHPSNLEPRTSSPSLTVRLYEDAASAAHVDLEASRRAAAPRANHPPEFSQDPNPGRNPDRNDAEALALDEEIAFRQAPVFEEPAGPPMPLPANLIEFPRQLVASRKARPRLAEGPLRDQADAAARDSQLRIFEVDPAQISTTPAADVESAAGATAPQWTSIWLDARAEPAPTELPDPQAAAILPGGQTAARTAPLPQVASIGRRVLAAAINGAIVLAGELAFAAVFIMVAGHVLPWQSGLPLHLALARSLAQTGLPTGLPLSRLPAAAAVAGGVLLLLYQALFFRFSTATPGMRCARIALCTFDDENPTRKALRRRILAVLLSACPLGLGFLWAALDEERLTWHDRLSRTYQRSY
jgi:uncharacterized RDD family membrane protein YckC